MIRKTMEDLQNARKRFVNSNHDQIDSDRLSNLPDPIIHHILSLMDTKSAVQTCVLSKKWTHHWTGIHNLDFDYESFNGKIKFRKFVCCVLLKCQSFNICKLRFRDRDYEHSYVAKKILNYVNSHKVEELETNSADVYSHLSKVETLGTLRLFNTYVKIPSNFASLTTLHLSAVRFSDGPDKHDDIFSGCLNLENLFIDRCWMANQEVFKISAPRIVNITISRILCLCPNMKLVISAPVLKCFDYSGVYVQLMMSIDECLALEKVKIHVVSSIVHLQTEQRRQEYALDMLRVAERLSHVKTVRISWNFSENYTLDHCKS